MCKKKCNFARFFMRMNELIDQASHIIVLTHMAPDGDAMGSALAMWHYVRDKGQSSKEVTVIVPNAFPAFFNWMPGADKIRVYEKEMAACNTLLEAADLFICTDFNDPKRIGPIGEKMMGNPCPKVMIDHHIIVENEEWNADKEKWTEIHSYPNASSACEIVYRLLYGDKSPITNHKPQISNEIASCIYTGLMTDTGNFSYNSTNAELYDIIASLLRASVNKDEIYNAVFNQYSVDRLRMTGFALYRKMRIYPEYHLALITLSADELDQYHYQVGDTEGIVNMPLQIADVYYSVFMREERPKPGTPKPRIRISFRSQGERPVNIWANEVFHGGGHANASGGELFGSLSQAVALFEKTYSKYIKK